MLILLRGPQLLKARIQTVQSELYLAKTVLDSGFHVKDSRFQVLDSGFNSSRKSYSGFQSPDLPHYKSRKLPGFRSSQAKIFLIPKSIANRFKKPLKLWTTRTNGFFVCKISPAWFFFNGLFILSFKFTSFLSQSGFLNPGYFCLWNPKS